MQKAYHSSLPAIQRRAAQSLHNCRHSVGKEPKTRSRYRQPRVQLRKTRRMYESSMARRRYNDVARISQSIGSDRWEGLPAAGYR